MFLLFWISIYVDSTCLSGKWVVSVVVDSYESFRNLMTLRVQHGKSLPGLIRLVAYLRYILRSLKPL